MTARPNPSDAWFAKADADFRACELVLATEPPLIDIACYHAQQCAEKSLKGYLVARNIPFKFVHELVYLTQLCAEEEPAFLELLTAASELQDYATSVRYPDSEASPLTLQDVRTAINRAEHIRAFVRNCV